jgi:hypothetical protein
VAQVVVKGRHERVVSQFDIDKESDHGLWHPPRRSEDPGSQANDPDGEQIEVIETVS